MRSISVRVLALAAALAGAGATSALPAAPRGVLHGTVVRGPITPVCRVGVPCDEPAPNVVLTFSRGGVVRAVRSNARGAYRVELPAGTYSVRTSSKPFGRVPRPATARVRAGRSDRIDFTIDTGIR